MRTLKKSLSLVLVLAMVFSFCVMGTNAAFADADKISADYATQVEIMNGLGILKGDDAGFRPADTLTRAEACVIITKMLGASDLAKTSVCTFDDVAADHWAAPYVGYCAAEGIVSGIGDNKFGPDNALSGYAFALMILRAIGYVPANENWNAEQWELCTVKLAKAAGLVGDVEDITADTFTREMAAGMAYTGLTCREVYYRGGSVVELPGGASVTTGATRTEVVDSDTTPSYLAENFGLAVNATYNSLDPATGIVTANGSNTAKSDIEKGLTTTIAAGSDRTAADAGTFAIVTDADLLGHYVALYHNDTTKAVDPGYAVVDKTVVTVIDYTMSAAQVKAALIESGYAISSTTAPATAALVFDDCYQNGGITANVDVDVVKTTGNFYSGYDFCVGQLGVAAVELYGYATTTGTVGYGFKLADNYDVAKVTKITDTEGKETITLSNGFGELKNNANADEVEAYEGIAKDDYVTVTKIGSVYYLDECSTVTGTLTKKASATDPADTCTLYIDGEPVYAFCYDDSSFGVVTELKAVPNYAAFNVGSEYTLYVDAYGYYFGAVAITEDAVVSDAVYVIDTFVKTADAGYGTDQYCLYAQVVDLEGKVSDVLVGVGSAGTTGATGTITALTAGIDHTDLALLEGKWVTYTADLTAPAVYYGIQTLTAVGAPSTYNGTTVTIVADVVGTNNSALTVDSKSIAMSATTKAYLTADTKVIFTNGQILGALKTNVVTGGVNVSANVLDADKALLTKDAQGNWIVVAIFENAAYSNTGSSALDYLYIKAQNTPTIVDRIDTNFDGITETNVYEYTAYKAATGEKVTITSTIDTTIGTAGFYSYIIKDGYYDVTLKSANATFVYGEYLKSMYGTLATTSTLADYDTADTLVFDVRSATAIASSGVAAIDSIETLYSLVTESKCMITFDVITNTLNGNKIVTLVVTGVTKTVAPASKADLQQLAKDLISVGQSETEALAIAGLATPGLTVSVSGNTVYLSGKVAAYTDADVVANQAGIALYTGATETTAAGVIAKFDAAHTDATKFAFVPVVIGGEMKVIAVCADGAVNNFAWRAATTAYDTYTINGVSYTIDISGLEWA